MDLDRDSAMVEGLSGPSLGPLHDRGKVTIHPLEMKYTHDLQIHALVQRAERQHSEFAAAM